MKNYLIILIILLAACKKDAVPFVDCNHPTSDIERCKKLIIGKWDWSYEKYAQRGSPTDIIKTPFTEGYTRQIEFKNSMHAFFYKNFSFEKEVNYSITTLDKVTNDQSDNSVTTLIFYDLQSGLRTDFTPINICNDSLSFNYISDDTKGQEKWSKN